MTKPLPMSNFRFVSDDELPNLIEDIPKWSFDDEESYILTCDLSVPKEMHESLKVRNPVFIVMMCANLYSYHRSLLQHRKNLIYRIRNLMMSIKRYFTKLMV